MFERIHLPEDWQERVIELTTTDSEVPSREAELQHWHDQVRRAVSGFKRGLPTEDEAAAMKEEAEARLGELAPASQDATLAAGDVLTDMCEAWGAMTALERREAAQITLERVAVDMRKGAVAGFEPKPDFAPLFETIARQGGPVEYCAWRPRADSNRRSPP